MPHPWTVDEEWAALHIYLTVGGSPSESDGKIIALDEAMGDSTPASIVLRVRNFLYLDTGSGMSKHAPQTGEVWEEYTDDPDGGVEKARLAYEDVTGIATD